MSDIRYTPTRERVTVLGIANEGQYRPEDPGTGMRLYAIRFPDGSTGQASGEELTRDGKAYRHGVECPRCHGSGLIPEVPVA